MSRKPSSKSTSPSGGPGRAAKFAVTVIVVVAGGLGVAVAASATGPASEFYKSGLYCCNNRLFDGNNHYLNYNESFPDGTYGSGGYDCSQEVVWPDTSQSYYDGPQCTYEGNSGHVLNGYSNDKALCWNSTHAPGAGMDCEAWWP